MGKKKILAIVAMLFLCTLLCVATIGAALLFRQNQMNQSQIKSLQDQVEQLKQEKEQGAKGNSSSDVPPTTTTTPATGTDSDTGATMVHFSKTPESDSDFSYTVAAARDVSQLEPVETSIAFIIAGPTATEAALGYVNPIILTGASNCGGSDFTTSTTLNATTHLSDTQIRFCRTLPTGIGPTAKIKSVITNTLEGLADPTTYHVGTIAILDKNGNCYGDESGMNICLH